MDEEAVAKMISEQRESLTAPKAEAAAAAHAANGAVDGASGAPSSAAGSVALAASAAAPIDPMTLVDRRCKRRRRFTYNAETGEVVPQQA